MLKPIFSNTDFIYIERQLIQDCDTFRYIKSCVRACVYYWFNLLFFVNFLGDERELLNVILFRQIHTLQELPGIVVFRGHVYGIEYMLRMPKISVGVYDLPINRLHHTFWHMLYGLKS